MRAAEPLEPEVLAALEAIDATLDGEPVDPEFAELAELALLVRGEAPAPSDAFLERLDARVRTRFASASPATTTTRRTGRAWRAWGAAGTLAAGVAVVVVLLVVTPWSGGPGSHAVPISANGSAAAGTAKTASSSSSSGGTSSAGAPTSPAPTVPPAPGRQVSQSAQLDLRAGAGRIDTVAREVFGVIGDEHGRVMRSQVDANATLPGSATFSLQVPSARLQATLDRLSNLARAQVVSRVDASADITAQIGGAASRLAVARALRRSLLHQLATAYTTHDIDHLKDELHRNAAMIAGDQTALTRLHGRVSDSAISVTVTAPAAQPHRAAHASSGFTIHRALHDAGRVLLVAAGVLLIAVAVLIPVALLVALAAWVWTFVLRRRREGALGR